MRSFNIIYIINLCHRSISANNAAANAQPPTTADPIHINLRIRAFYTKQTSIIKCVMLLWNAIQNNNYYRFLPLHNHLNVRENTSDRRRLTLEFLFYLFCFFFLKHLGIFKLQTIMLAPAKEVGRHVWLSKPWQQTRIRPYLASSCWVLPLKVQGWTNH